MEEIIMAVNYFKSSDPRYSTPIVEFGYKSPLAHRKIYLAVFRLRKFQFSGTADGEWEYGSGRDLPDEWENNVLHNPDGAKEFLNKQLDAAVEDLCKYRYRPTDECKDEFLNDIESIREDFINDSLRFLATYWNRPDLYTECAEHYDSLPVRK
jgi:hypothetical protein